MVMSGREKSSEVLARFPAPRKTASSFPGWRFRTFVSMLIIALLPTFIFRSTTGVSSTILLVVGTFVFDALIRRQRKWVRYEGEYTRLKRLLSEEAVEDFYTESKEATKSPPDPDAEVHGVIASS